MPKTYPEPVAQLLALGDPYEEELDASPWCDYVALGLTDEHVPQLVEMIADPELLDVDLEGDAIWAPLHAWRALGQLRAESAIDPLIRLLDRVNDDDWAQMDLPHVFGMIGPSAIPALRAAMADAGRSEWVRIAAGSSLVRVVERFPESREPAIAALAEQLGHLDAQERLVNAYLVDALCDLKAVESASTIEQAFAANQVDLSVLGDWEEAQILLGLLEERMTPAPDFVALEFGLLPRSPRPVRHKASKEKKAKRKQAQASRKRNRKR